MLFSEQHPENQDDQHERLVETNNTTSAKHSRKGRRTHPSWRVLDPEDELSQTFVQINKLHLAAARMTCPDEGDFIPDHNTRVHARAGITNYRADQLAVIGLTLQRFPKVAAMFEEGAFCLQLMHRICEHLEPITPERQSVIDIATVKLLQPSVGNQAMRTLAWIDEKLTALIDELEPLSRPIPEA